MKAIRSDVYYTPPSVATSVPAVAAERAPRHLPRDRCSNLAVSLRLTQDQAAFAQTNQALQAPGFRYIVVNPQISLADYTRVDTTTISMEHCEASRPAVKMLLISFVGVELFYSRIPNPAQNFSMELHRGRGLAICRALDDNNIRALFKIAARYGNQWIMQFLLREPFLGRLTDEDFGFAFIGAAGNGHRDVMDFLLQNHRARLNDLNCKVAFHDAAKNGHQRVMDFLLQNLITRLTDDDFGWGFSLPARNGHRGIMDFLLQNHRARLTHNWYFGDAFANAAANGHRGIMDFLLLEHGDRITDGNIHYARFLATSNNQRDIVKFLDQLTQQEDVVVDILGQAAQQEDATVCGIQ